MHRMFRKLLICAVPTFALACGSPRLRVEGLPSSASEGERIYVRQNCANCHGVGGAGAKRLGPPLRKLAQNWDLASLQSFLQEPEPLVENSARLKALSQKYRGKMSGDPLTEVQLAVLIEYLMTLLDRNNPEGGERWIALTLTVRANGECPSLPRQALLEHPR